jgi:putative transposase
LHAAEFMLIAHRIELILNNRERTYLAKCCGCARLAFNWAKEEWEQQYQRGEKPSAMALKKQFNAVKYQLFPFIDEVSQYPISQAFFDLAAAYRNFFRSVKAKDGQFRKPKFKSKRQRPSAYFANTALQVDGRRIYLQKLGWVGLREELRFDGKIMGARVSREGRRWYIAIQVELPYVRHRRRTKNRIKALTGIDLGSTELAVLSNGETHLAPKSYNRRLEHLGKLQARAAKLTKGSNRHKRMQERIRVLHAKIARERQGVQHQLTAYLTRRYRNLAVQEWNVKAMTKSAAGTRENPGKHVKVKALFNRHLLDAGPYEIRRQLDYKAKRRATTLLTLPESRKTSRTCSLCSHEQDVTPDMDKWTCEGCGATHRRKHNTAVNIRRWASASADLAEPSAG